MFGVEIFVIRLSLFGLNQEVTNFYLLRLVFNKAPFFVADALYLKVTKYVSIYS